MSVLEHDDAKALGTTLAEEGQQASIQEDDQSLLGQIQQQEESLLHLALFLLLMK